jgi:hypothetical protein
MSFNHSRMVVGLLASPPLEVDAWLAVGRRPLGRRLPPREPLRVCPRDATAPSTSTVQLYSCTTRIKIAQEGWWIVACDRCFFQQWYGL